MTSTSMTSSSTAPLIHSHLNDYGALLNVLLSYFLTSVKKGSNEIVWYIIQDYSQ